MKNIEFYELCKQRGLDKSVYDFHFTDVKAGNRYKTKKTKNTTARWLILAINELNIFAVWDLNNVIRPCREIYSINRNTVINLKDNRTLTKAVEYPNRKMEMVYLVPFEEMISFIVNY